MNELQNWLNNPDRDYAAGVALFAQHCKNKALVRYFQTGTARFRMAKLVYEMGKLAKTVYLAGSPTATNAFSVIGSAQHSRLASKITANTSQVCRRASKVSIPDFILAAKKEISTLYSVIDKKHRELYDLGTSNADDVVRKRKRILDDRKPAIERADRLYQLKEEWFALEDSPGRERVAKEIQKMLAAPLEIENSELKVENRESVKEMTDMQLSKRRTQLRSSISKTQNMLQYQSIRKAAAPTPMPPGPKRDEYERKLKKLKAELTMVTDEIYRRTKN